MANQTGRPIAPARKLVAAVMGTLAVFVIVYGLGMSSWAVALFGLAVLVLAVVLAIVNMPRRGGRATVAGNAEVKSIPPMPLNAAYGRADIEVIVVAPGLGTFDTVLRESRIPVAKWPVIGATVPITVDVDDTRRVRVNWNDAPLRDEGGDPPPPAAQAAYQEAEEPDDDLLGDIGPAPWEGRERDWQFEQDEPPPPPPPPSRAAYAAGPTTPVVVRDTPAGTIVEGQVVGGDDDPPPPLPRRAAGAAFGGGSDDPIPPPPGPGRSSSDSAYAPPPPPGPGRSSASSASSASSDSDYAPPPGPAFSTASAPFSGAGSSRPRGTRPSPRPRGSAATATVERDQEDVDSPSSAPSEGAGGAAAAAAAGFAAGAAAPPSQRTSTESVIEQPEPDATSAREAEPLIDLPLDEEPERPATSSGRTRFFEQPGNAPSESAAAESASDASGIDQPVASSSSPWASDFERPEPEPAAAAPPAPRPEPEPAAAARPSPRPEPVPASSPVAPSPVAPPPVAPTPDRPFPTAPAPETATGPAAPRVIDDIDIPLDDVPTTVEDSLRDGSPEPPPEVTPAASEAVAEDIVAPPATAIPDETVEESSPAEASSVPVSAASGPAAGSEPAASGPIAAGESAASGSVAGSEPADEGSGSGGGGIRAAVAGAAGAVAGFVAGRVGGDRGGSRSGEAGESEGVGPGGDASRGSGSDAESSSSVRTGEEAAGETPRATNPWGDFGGRPEPDARAADVITAYPSARPGPAGAIHGVGITVLVTDLNQSISFYRDMLGFYEIDNGEDSAVLASGDTRLVLRTVHNLPVEAGRLIYLNLEVGDVEAVYEELRAKGVKFVHTPRPVNRGDKLELWSATFRDPDNHSIAITQWRAIR